LETALKGVFNRVLTVLWLQDNIIRVDGAKAIAEALKVNAVVNTLYLGGNSIGDEGAKAIAEALKVNAVMTTLNLGGNNIGVEGAKAIAEALKVTAVLTTLELGYNSIGDDGAKAIAEALKVTAVLKNLRKASASGTEFTGKWRGKNAISHSIASFQTSAHASGRPCSKELMTNELNDDTGGRPPSRCPAGIRDRPVTPCARSPGTTAAHGCRLIACVCRPARRPTSRTVQDGAQASISALKRAAHARSQAGACYSLCRARQRATRTPF